MFKDFNAITRGRIDDEVVTTARQEYNKCYGDEMKLNEVFNSFVTHYQCAYQGPNTLRGQIDVRVKNSRKQSKHIPYSRKFSRDPIFTERLPSRFRDLNF